MEENRIKEDDKYIIFESMGGLGKQIQATAVIRAIKKKYPERKIIWITSWDAPAFNNPNVFRFFLHGEAKYFKDYLKDDTIIMKHDPYNETNHILRKEHLTESWCKMFDIPYDGSKPEKYIKKTDKAVKGKKTS